MSDKFEDIFKNRLNDFEHTPPPNAWKNISASLGDNFENIFQDRLSNFEHTPPPNAWNNIAAQITPPSSYFGVLSGIAAVIITVILFLLPNPTGKYDYNNLTITENANIIYTSENQELTNSSATISTKSVFDKTAIPTTQTKNISNSKNIVNVHSVKTQQISKNKVGKNQFHSTKNSVSKSKKSTPKNSVATQNIANNNTIKGGSGNIRNGTIIISMDENADKNAPLLGLTSKDDGKEETATLIAKNGVTAAKDVIPDKVTLMAVELLKLKKETQPFFSTKVITNTEINIAPKEESTSSLRPFFITASVKPQFTYGRSISNIEDNQLITNITNAKRFSQERSGFNIELGAEKQVSKKITIQLGFGLEQIKYGSEFEFRSANPTSMTTVSTSKGVSVTPNYDYKNAAPSFKYNLLSSRIGVKYLFQGRTTNKYVVASFGINKLQSLKIADQKQGETSVIKDFGGRTNSNFQIAYGVEKAISKNIRLNVAPTFSYYFKTLPSNDYKFSLKPYNVGLNFSIAYRFR